MSPESAPPQEELPPLSAYDDDAQAPEPRKGNGSDGSPHIPPLTVEALNWPALAPLAPPERKWAIKGWLGFGHVTLLVGPGGIGKTLLAQQMASCLALQRQFIEPVDTPHKCLMWACEDDHDELWRRQIAISRWCKAGLEEFHDTLTIVPRHGLENTIVSDEFGRPTFSALLPQLAEQANDLHADIVILDNAGQLYGGNENNRHAVTVFLNALAGSLHGKAIMLLAHPSRGLNSEFSGSSAWENVARTRLYFGANLPGAPKAAEDDSEPTDDVRYLSRRKANYSAKDYRRMVYADGALTPDEPDADGGIMGQIKARNAERTLLAGLARFTAMGIATTDGRRSGQYLPKLISEYKIDDGVQQRELTEALRVMLLSGRLIRALVGQNANRTKQYGLKDTKQ